MDQGEDALESFRRIAENLLALEVNTMISDGMTADKMPAAGVALIQIAFTYHRFLAGCISALPPTDDGLNPPPNWPMVTQGGDDPAVPFTDWSVRTGGVATFALLRYVARLCKAGRAAALGEQSVADQKDVVLTRIGASCNEVCKILKSIGLGDAPIDLRTVQLAGEQDKEWPQFSHEALVSLRKIWELGTNTVVMQTVVQIDGDVIVRVLEGWQWESSATMHEIHRKAVDVSLQRWTFLVNTAESLLGFFRDVVVRPKSVPAPRP